MDADTIPGSAVREYARSLIAQDQQYRDTFDREFVQVILAAPDRPADADNVLLSDRIGFAMWVGCPASEQVSVRLESALAGSSDESIVDCCDQLLYLYTHRARIIPVCRSMWDFEEASGEVVHWPLAEPGQQLWSAVDELVETVRQTLAIQLPEELAQSRDWYVYGERIQQDLQDSYVRLRTARRHPGLLELGAVKPVRTFNLFSCARTVREARQKWDSIAGRIAWILKQCGSDVPRWEEKIVEASQPDVHPSYLEDWESSLRETIEAVEAIAKAYEEITTVLAGAPAEQRWEAGGDNPPDYIALIQYLEYLVSCCRPEDLAAVEGDAEDETSERPLKRRRIGGDATDDGDRQD